MNDYDIVLVTDLRPDVALARPDQLAAARAQLTAAIVAQPGDDAAWAGDQAPQIFPPPRPVAKRTRRWQAAGTIAGLAVAAGVAVALVISSVAGPTPGPGRGSGKHHPQPVVVTAAQWLSSAAAAVSNQRTLVPRPGQYVYTVVGQPNTSNNEGAWLSADGRKAAFFGRADGHGGHIRVAPCPVPAAERHTCEFDAGYVPQMPTNPRALAKFLVKVGIATTSSGPPHQSKNRAADVLGKSLLTMFTSMDLTPRQRAALFKLMAQTHGFFLVRHAVDAMGRVGTGIAWSYGGGTVTLIFDSHSYAFLGWTLSSHPIDRVSLILQKIVNRPPSFK